MTKTPKQCPVEFSPIYYSRYVNDISFLSGSQDYLIKFCNYLKKCHPNMDFLFGIGKSQSILDVAVSRKGKFVTTAHRKTIFSGVYTHLGSLLQCGYKFSIIHIKISQNLF